MKPTTPFPKPFVAAALLAVTLCIAHGQGALDPPAGEPAPSMKTLQQIWDKLDNLTAGVTADARTPIDSLPVTLDSPGSYYFTRNLQFSGLGSAITVAADRITIDLNGFSLSSTPVTFGSGIVVSSSSQPRRLTVKNGFISGTTIVSDLSTTWNVVSGGFINGIYTPNGGNYLVRLYDVTVSGCQTTGVKIGGLGIVHNCTAMQNGDKGFDVNYPGSIFDHCIALHNKDIGFEAGSAVFNHCTAFQNGGHGFQPISGTVSHCLASANGGDGIFMGTSSAVVAFCRAVSNQGTNINVLSFVERTGNSPSP